MGTNCGKRLCSDTLSRLYASGARQLDQAYPGYCDGFWTMDSRSDWHWSCVSWSAAQQGHLHRMATWGRRVWILFKGWKWRGPALNSKRQCIGCVQSPLMFFKTYAKHLEKMGLKQSLTDPCIWYKHDTSNQLLLLVAVYVDDCIVVGTNSKLRPSKLESKRVSIAPTWARSRSTLACGINIRRRLVKKRFVWAWKVTERIS